ncbi:MAG: polymer-forming cytoskeletal protein [Acidobacteriota bacterium]|jgi:cytoskeletal protein CcmA (bactofilin family)|nr:polymer-forming cytoskeletal protein [Acidobacteriota bacterium]
MGFMQGKATGDIGSQLGQGVELSGEFYFAKGARIGGVVKGKIKADDMLEIGATGRVEADIEVRRISIQGEFRGTIRASERVEIHKDGKVYGDVYTPCLIIESDALFNGQCNMGENAKAIPERPERKEAAEPPADEKATGKPGKK